MNAACHVTDAVTQEAVGSIEAQQVIRRLQDESIGLETAWFQFVTIAARHGWRSAACRAYVAELAKHAAAG